MKRSDVVEVCQNALGKGAKLDKLAQLIADMAVKSGIASPDQEGKADKGKK